MEKIRKGDQVMVVTGKDKRKKGEVIRYLHDKRKIVVKGINIAKKTVKKSKDKPAGGFIEIEMPLSVSNVMLVCPKCGKITRVGITVSGKGERKRNCKKCGNVFD